MTIDFNNVKFYDGDFTREEDYKELIEESDSITLDSWILFSVDGLSDGLNIDFTQEIEGYWTHCPGDHWTPPDSNFDLIKNEVFINRATIDDIEVEITSDFERILLNIVIDEIERPKRKDHRLIYNL
jgi:hypothetical protein